METFKKRQKAWARKEKQQKKAARKMERRNEKARSANKIGEGNPAAPRTVKSGIIDRKCCIFILDIGANTNGNNCSDDEKLGRDVGGIVV